MTDSHEDLVEAVTNNDELKRQLIELQRSILTLQLELSMVKIELNRLTRDPRQEGRESYARGVNDNPYRFESPEWWAWREGRHESGREDW